MRLTVVILTALFVLGGCGGDDSASTTTRHTGSASTTASTTSSSASTGSIASHGSSSTAGPSTTAGGGERTVSEYTEFSSPSGNIRCAMDPTYARCDIGERTWSPPPKPADCELDYGQGISLEDGGSAGLVCAGDTVGNGGPVLAYGQSLVAGNMRCTSAQDGMSCKDTSTGHGFSLSRERYSIS